jgi:hypothetical protein
MITAQGDLGGAGHFQLMVEELGRKFVMAHLAISRQQLAAWLIPDAKVPRASVLALYWETRWGRSLIDSDRETELQLLQGLVECHKVTIQELGARVRILETELRSAAAPPFLSANERWFSQTQQTQPSRSRSGYDDARWRGSESADMLTR